MRGTSLKMTALSRLIAAIVFWATCASTGGEWHPGTGFRWADLKVRQQGHIGFQLLTPEETGIGFTNKLSELTGAANRVLLNGSGVAVGDFDNDGLPDIFFVRSRDVHRAL